MISVYGFKVRTHVTVMAVNGMARRSGCTVSDWTSGVSDGRESTIRVSQPECKKLLGYARASMHRLLEIRFLEFSREIYNMNAEAASCLWSCSGSEVPPPPPPPPTPTPAGKE